MNIIKTLTDTTLTIVLQGRLDTVTAPKLEAEIKHSLTGVTELIWDFAGVEYVSSAGLRVLLSTQKVMNKQGEMILRNVCDAVNEVFEITGFVDILTIE